MDGHPMNPIAFRIGTLSIHWYGVMVALGFLAGVGIMQLNRRHGRMTADQVADLTFFTLLGGILGARLWYVVQFWGEFRHAPLEVVMIQKGGLVYYGGFLVALAVIYGFCRRRGVEAARVFDLFSPGLAAGHALGRIGCFLQGCCHGRAATGPLSFRYPALGYAHDAQGHVLNSALAGPVYPVQLFEAAGNAALAAVLFFALRRLRPGRTAALYLIAYGSMRFALEFLRGDHRDRLFGVLTPAQGLGAVLVPAGIIVWLLLAWRDRCRAA